MMSNAIVSDRLLAAEATNNEQAATDLVPFYTPIHYADEHGHDGARYVNRFNYVETMWYALHDYSYKVLFKYQYLRLQVIYTTFSVVMSYVMILLLLTIILESFTVAR